MTEETKFYEFSSNGVRFTEARRNGLSGQAQGWGQDSKNESRVFLEIVISQSLVDVFHPPF